METGKCNIRAVSPNSSPLGPIVPLDICQDVRSKLHPKDNSGVFQDDRPGCKPQKHTMTVARPEECQDVESHFHPDSMVLSDVCQDKDPIDHPNSLAISEVCKDVRPQTHPNFSAFEYLILLDLNIYS